MFKGVSEFSATPKMASFSFGKMLWGISDLIKKENQLKEIFHRA